MLDNVWLYFEDGRWLTVMTNLICTDVNKITNLMEIMFLIIIFFDLLLHQTVPK